MDKKRFFEEKTTTRQMCSKVPERGNSKPLGQTSLGGAGVGMERREVLEQNARE